MKTNTKKPFIRLEICILAMVLPLVFPLQAQQWFVNDFDVSSAITEKPDYRPGGTHVTINSEGSADGVLIYGTMGYTENELSGGDGGHGKADVVILHNDLEGQNNWAISFGTGNRDVVSRVVQDSEGHIIVSGITRHNSQNQVFIASIDPSALSVIWANLYGPGTPTDMIVINQPGGSDPDPIGYAVSGYSGDDAFIIRTDLNGQASGSGWSYYYKSPGNSLRFTSLIQYKAKVDRVVNALFDYEPNFIVSGIIDGRAYVASIGLPNGDIWDDLDFGNVFYNCHSEPSRFVSIDQAENGEMALFGSSGSEYDKIHLTRISLTGSFQVLWDRRFSGGQPSMHGFPLDVNATAFGFLGTFEYSGSSHRPFKTVEYDFDGTITRWDNLVNGNASGTNWYFSKEIHQVTAQGLFPYVDFDMECAKALHLTGTESTCPNPPSGWAQDNIPHARLRLNSQSCIEEEITFTQSFCEEEDIYNFQEGTVGLKSNPLNEEPFDPMMAAMSPDPNTFCESTCPQSACLDAIIAGSETPAWVMLPGDPGYVDYVWSDGTVHSNSISVYVDGWAAYSVDQIDANGCVTTKYFNVMILLRKNGIADGNEEEKSTVELYPNPTNGIIQLILPEDGITLVVRDATGKLIQTSFYENRGEYTIDLTGQAQGLYFISLMGNGLNEKIKVNLTQ
mgnify:CR=1 FL=1